jgi:prephenate dehydrogenase
VTSDTRLDGVEKLVEGASAEQLDVLAMRTDAREDVVVVGCPVRLEEDVVTETERRSAGPTDRL